MESEEFVKSFRDAFREYEKASTLKGNLIFMDKMIKLNDQAITILRKKGKL